MCGIAVILHKDKRHPVDRTTLLRMTEMLRHRGPDCGGVFLDQEVGMGSRRLCVLDIEGGLQPMQGPCGKTYIVYNGEVYNYRELRRELEGKGIIFRTFSDTEVLLALYEQDGPRFVERLNGMFAFAIWDQRDRTLLLGRDRLGIKPLYIWDGPEAVVAASEIKAILAYPGAPRVLREGSLSEYLVFRQLSGGRTMFASVDAMAPATIRAYRDGRSTSHSYWCLQVGQQRTNPLPMGQAAEELRAVLGESVKLQLVSDVPLGTFNSGGLDSSLVTALASKFVSEPLRTFSVGFTEKKYDERRYARTLSAHIGSLHEDVMGDANEFAQRLPAAIWYHDEPLDHANSVLIGLLSEHAKRKVTVVLTGEGSDEVFAGYPRYRLARILKLIRMLGSWPERLLAFPLRLLKGRKVEMVRSSLGRGESYVIAANAQHFALQDIEGLTSGDPLEERLRYAPQGQDFLACLQSFELGTYLQKVLERMDKMTMSAGLEARVPFLDHRVVEFAFQLPSRLKMPLVKTKAVVRQAADGVIPGEIISRPKSGFGVPVGDWMRPGKPLCHFLDMLLEPRSLQRGWWDNRRLLQVVKEHRSGLDRGELLWSVVNCELWARIMLEEFPKRDELELPQDIAIVPAS